MAAKRVPQSRSRPDGQVVPFVAVLLIALLAILVLGIDIGLLFTARSEAQRSADAIALAGASAFIATSPGLYTSVAKERAKAYAGDNFVRTEKIDTVTVFESEDRWESSEVVVQVIVDSLKVRAHVRRQALPLWFARLLGPSFGSVGATAAAQAVEAGVNTCMVPFGVPVDPEEEFEVGELMTLKSADDAITEGVDPFFAPFQLPEDPNVAPWCPGATGREDGAWGALPRCSTCDPQNGRFPGETFGGWHQTAEVDSWLDWTADDGEGSGGVSGQNYTADGYAENVCGDNCSSMEAGERVDILTGDRDGPTSWGVNTRLALDPKVEWDDHNKQIVRGSEALEGFDVSPRVVKVPTFDPNDPEFSHSSDRSFEVTGFAYFFLEKGPHHGFYDPSDQLEIKGRLLFYAPGHTGGTSSGPFSRVLRLVE